MKGTVFQPEVLQLNLDNINRLPHSKFPEEKIGEFAGAGIEPTTFFYNKLSVFCYPIKLLIIKQTWLICKTCSWNCSNM